jgi:hypothetical protein
MAPTIRGHEQADLLAWEAPAPVQKFERHRVRAATLSGRIKRGIAEALREHEDRVKERRRALQAHARISGTLT